MNALNHHLGLRGGHAPSWHRATLDRASSRFTCKPPSPSTLPHTQPRVALLRCFCFLMVTLNVVLSPMSLKGQTRPPWIWTKAGHLLWTTLLLTMIRGLYSPERRGQLPQVRSGRGAEGRRGKEEERGKDPLPAHLNPHQLFETLQEAAVVQRRDPELLVEDACLKSFCTCCMKLDVPPQSFLIYEGRWCSSPPRLTGKSRRETGRGTDFFFFSSSSLNPQLFRSCKISPPTSGPLFVSQTRTRSPHHPG